MKLDFTILNNHQIILTLRPFLTHIHTNQIRTPEIIRLKKQLFLYIPNYKICVC